VQSPALLTGFARWQDERDSWWGCEEGSWYQTEDRCSLENQFLTPLGRAKDYVKVSGEGVNLALLEKILSGLESSPNVHVLAIPHERSEHEILLLHTPQISSLRVRQIFEQFNQKVAPYERATRVLGVPEIPRTDLGKVAREVLASRLSKLFKIK